MSTAAVEVTTSATQILTKNRDRIHLVLHNMGQSSVFLGDSSSVTKLTGVPFYAGDRLEFGATAGPFQFFYRGDIYGITEAGTGDVRVWEITDVRV